MLSYAPEKTVPEDIQLVDSQGRSRGTLFERLPRLHQDLQEKAEAFFSIRVLVPEEHRARVAQSPISVDDLLER